MWKNYSKKIFQQTRWLKSLVDYGKKYEDGGDKELRLDLLENIISTSYTKNYEGGLLAWL